MGWLCRKLYGEKTGDIIRDAYTYENEKARSVVLDMAKVGRATYLAVELTTKADGKTIVYAGVCLGEMQSGEFCWKSMDETVGPNEAQCPARILDRLTPTEYQHAIEWRQKCRDALAARRTAVPITPGVKAIFAEPVRFGDGRERREFTAERNGVKAIAWRGEDGVLCRISRDLLQRATLSPAA